MESNNDMEVVNVAIQRLIEEEKKKKRSRQVSLDGDFFKVEDDDEEDQLLSKLLSQVESLKGNGAINQIPPELLPKTKETISQVIAASENSKSSDEKTDETPISMTEEIVKELKEVKRQNTITHWLVSILIVLTVTWQLSEVSLILKVKDGVTHPLRSFKNMVTGIMKKVPKDGKDHLEEALGQNLSNSIPGLKMPELPKIDMSELGIERKS